MKPILFNTEMVRAIMDGRKTVTRRVVKPQPIYTIVPDKKHRKPMSFFVDSERWIKPPCQSGEILYVRETWAAWSRTEGIAPKIHYKADGECLKDVKWRPSIHMPRDAARLFLRVKSVKVERLQEISAQGLIEEGLFSIEGFRVGMIRDKFLEFEQLWNSTLKPADRALYSWNANPWVWVIEFDRITREEAAE